MNPLTAGARDAKPTRKHRPAIWEMLLGTVYASNGTEVRYFDYDWDAAREFAGVTPDADPRHALARFSQRSLPARRPTASEPRPTQRVLFVLA
jgi:hypothetical protein